MKILYGVVGEGMGHAIRSRAVIGHLVHDEKHQVAVVVSGRAYEVLKKYFPDVHDIWGLIMTYRDNEFKVVRSIVENIKQSLTGIPDNIIRYMEIAESFEPECVISDFESWSYLFGIRHGLPILCIDNIQMIARCTHPEEFVRLHEKDFLVTKAFVKGKLPLCHHYYVTTFFYPEVRKPRTTLVPPVLRREILEARPSEGEHVLVYQTSDSAGNLPAVLKSLDVPFVVYGYRRDIGEDVEDGSVRFRPFDESAFIRDLASARAVIANGGFTLLGEAVHLCKPVLSVPVKAQFEQVLNGWYLERLGYGCTVGELDAAAIRHFLSRLDSYREKLASYDRSEGNGRLFALLDEHLDRIAGHVD
jgi:uncharacterized protein (TIGR00661 family)